MTLFIIGWFACGLLGAWLLLKAGRSHGELDFLDVALSLMVLIFGLAGLFMGMVVYEDSIGLPFRIRNDKIVAFFNRIIK